MPQRIIALEIGKTELKATVLETTFRDYRIAEFRQATRVLGEEPEEAQIRRFVEDNQLSGDTILSSLSGESVTWRTFFLPFRDRKRLAQTIPFELENHVPFDLDEAVIDYQILRQDGDGTTILAGLVQREDLERHLALLNAAGLDPKVVALGPLATLNSLSLLPAVPPSILFLDFGSHSITAALQRDGQLIGLRTLTVEEAAVGDNGAAMDRLVADLRWTFLALNDGPLEDGLPCYVSGETADIDVIRPALERALGVEIKGFADAELRNMDQETRVQLPAFASTVGLALREVTPAATLGLDFRRGEYAYHRSQQEMQRGLRTVAALAALVIALTVTDVYIEYRQMAARVREINGQILQVTRATLPDLIDMRDPTRELQDEIDARQHELDIINEIVPVSSSTSLDIFRAVSAAIPNSIRIDADDYMMDADAIRMRGNTDSFDSVDAIKQHVLGTGFFSDVQVKDARVPKRGTGVDFRLIMRLSKDLRRGRGTR